MIEVTAGHLGGTILTQGPVRSRELRTENAFDIGTIVVGELDWMGAVARDLIEPLLAKSKAG